MVFITGVPGIGKTTLAEAFLDSAAQQLRVHVTLGQCLDHRGTPEAYLPVLDALGRLCRGPQGPRVIALLRRYAPTWLLQMPALLDEQERQALQQQWAGTSSERMLREMAEALEALAAEHALVLLLEDLQWSDHATLDLVSFIARRQEPARLLVLGTYRPAEVMAAEHPLKGLSTALLSHGQCHEVSLELLTPEDVAAYLQRAFPGIAGHKALARLIYRYTGGNPLCYRRRESVRNRAV